MERFCEECGAPNTTQACFCVTCGHKLRSLDISTEIHIATEATGETSRTTDFAQGDVYQQPLASSPAASSRTRTALIAVGALLVGVVITVTLRELGTLDFALGEKVSVEDAKSQADTSYQAGFSEGKIKGIEEGDQQGYSRGFDEGKAAGFTEGDESGYSRGYETGRDVGFIDAKAGITPTNLGSLGLSVDWANLTRGGRGMCVFSFGASLSGWDSWKWAFIASTGEIRTVSDSYGGGNCYNSSYFSERIGSLGRYSRLAVYVTANGKTDRWGPFPIPRD
jgi:hypothetical protein